MCIFNYEERCIKNGRACSSCDNKKDWPSQDFKKQVLKPQMRPADELISRLRLVTSRIEKSVDGSYCLDSQDLKPLVEQLESYCEQRQTKSQVICA